MKPTKEELVELIGMAELLEARLRDMDENWRASDAWSISSTLRHKLDRMCGEEYLESLRNPDNGNH